MALETKMHQPQRITTKKQKNKQKKKNPTKKQKDMLHLREGREIRLHTRLSVKF